ncbi:MAG: DUF2027 domain-containing protein [Bacteroidales bacterium]|nr:DUF2027 domain-containing protein [Bacteroidales bacterium]
MKYKVGDKVKFLNEVGGGVVKKILSPTMVEVAMEDGFDIPMHTNEILPAQTDDIKASVFNRDFNADTVQAEENREEETYDRVSKLQQLSSLQNKQKGVYLAYIPHDQVWLLKDDIDICLINYTSYEILYSFVLVQEDGTYTNTDYGNIAPYSKALLQTISRDDIEQWLHGYVQVLFMKESDTAICLPMHQEFKVKMLRFMKKESFSACNFLEEKSVLIHIGGPMKDSRQDILKKDDTLLNAGMQQPAHKETSPIDGYKIAYQEAEVDLHIESLVNDHSRYDASQILDIQKKKIIEVMEDAIANHYKKVVFIHGVGNGTLKQELIKILQQYTGIHYFNASMQKYGCGATEVLIGNKSCREA